MAKLGKEQIMVASQMVTKGASIRQVARQMGVTEGALRYRLKKRDDDAPRPDGRSLQPTATVGYEEAVRAILEAADDARLTGKGRPMQARRVFDLLVRDHGYGGSYQAVVRHLRRSYGAPKLRALRRVETPPGVQAQHDWFEAWTTIAGKRVLLPVLVGTFSHSRARFPWVSRTADQLAWHTGHLALFRRYGGVPLWVRIDNLKTGVAKGAGGNAVLNRSYEVFGRECGFEIDPCRARKGSDKGKAERSVRTFRDRFGDLFAREWRSVEELQAALAADAAVPPRRLKAKRYLNSALLIVDEVGFRPLDRHEANLLFRLVSARYEKGSIVLTSNRHVRDWPEIFAGDEVLTTAILDRLLHHCHVVHIDGRSYRLRELDGLLREQGPHPSPPSGKEVKTQRT